MDYIVVASHCEYSEARDKLLGSLWGEGVLRDRVVVVLNGSESGGGHGCAGVHPDGYHVVTFGTNLFEYSSFLVPGVLDGAADSDRFLLLHDTSLALPGFGAKAARAFARHRAEGVDILWCSATGQCNLCVFGPRVGEVARSLWGSRGTLDKRHAVEMEHCAGAEGSIKGASALKQVYAEEASEPRGVDWPYASGHERSVLYFPFLGLTKFFYNLERWAEHPNVP